MVTGRYPPGRRVPEAGVMRLDAVLIAGPTCSGKSALALRLARTLGGPIVNADSMQVYRDLGILTARPSPEDEAAWPHRLYGHVDAGHNGSVGDWLRDAVQLLDERAPGDAPPIFVGGSGLYFKALTEGLSTIPAVPAAVRDAVREAAAGKATPDLHAELGRLDPEGAARLRSNDRLRVLRAIEVARATGRPISSFHGARKPGPLAAARLAKLFLLPPRDAIRSAIDARFVRMIETGALDEVAALASRRLDPALPAMRAHGVPGLLAYLRGECSLADAVARGQADTRAYAKRQVTWFRHQMPDWTSIAPEDAAEEAERLVSFGGTTTAVG